MGKPRLLDLFCGAGGAAMGYYRAGFEVVGVDIAPQKHYPFEFHQADALTYPLDGFDVIHASPPCQASSLISRNLGYAQNHVDLIPETRPRLEASGVPWIMENVPGAPLHNWVVLCGSSFGLGIPEYGWYLQRHRLFESNLWLWSSQCSHHGRAITCTGTGTPKAIKDAVGRTVKVHEYRRLMGIDWMTRAELSQAIPPAFTQWIGSQLLVTLRWEASA